MKGVNALYGPFLISTEYGNGWGYDALDECQCPIRAFFNFYACIRSGGGAPAGGVNALYGPFLISTPERYI